MIGPLDRELHVFPARNISAYMHVIAIVTHGMMK